ncbi:SLATT domain-containing protein [Marinoscillum sp. 108]|uniref:SLATT domain-containing protein n=1 Tax=Marinoscillum sp. 108 TaxID=2653151 RepID=UPI0012F0BA0F|nr:SLATT domain-containing protein [Marinoscillum sp. 108]VXD15848.1 SLATT domain-containing protein [Marinoscillum sp. 108]
MQNTTEKVRRIKVDALYGKKKHFNAADRNQSIHYRIGVPLIVINVITGSILFYALTDGIAGWIKYFPLVLSFVSALLVGFQTYFNFQKKVEGHRRIGNRYLAIMKKCDRLLGYFADNAVSESELIDRLEKIAHEIEEINKEAESLPTSDKDYKLAKAGIEAGEESYTENELNL